MRIVESAILSTDLAIYSKKWSKFQQLIENGQFDWQQTDKKHCELLWKPKCSDLSAPFQERVAVARVL